jgi:hypothetical protein
LGLRWFGPTANLQIGVVHSLHAAHVDNVDVTPSHEHGSHVGVRTRRTHGSASFSNHIALLYPSHWPLQPNSKLKPFGLQQLLVV